MAESGAPERMKRLLLGGYLASLQDTDGKARYLEKLSILGGFDPYESEKSQWLDDIDLWPSITHIHLAMYLLYTPSRYTGEDLYESDIHIERIFPDEQFWLDQVSRVKDFFTKSILPELLGKFYSRKDEPKATSNTAQDPCCSVTSGDVTDGEGGSNEASKMKLYCYC